MKRLLTLALCLALLCPAAAAAEGEEALWTRTEGDGSYVTIRLPCPQGEELDWSERQWLAVRYADTGEPVPLTSDYQRGFLFATVPAEDANRPLEAFQGEEHHFPDCTTVWQGHAYYDEPGGTEELYLRGVIQGDQTGNLNPDAALTRAAAFALICRLLSLEPGGDPGYADVSPGDWYYETASAARAAGIAAADTRFNPARTVTRGEFTVMLARAMEYVGWLTIPETGSAGAMGLADAGEIPGWALGAYQAFDGQGLSIVTWRPTGETDPNYGEPEVERLAEWDKPATRGEVITFLDNARVLLPWYPSQAAIDWGFDREMPEVDGSTSTYPYTTAVYGALFSNYRNHPQFPESHSKSHESYERLISGEVDFLFAATLPSEELKARAEAAGVELTCIPIAYDAMVFFTNAENAIDGLTLQQIQDIYVYGKYANWNQVGGPDAELLPYRRNADSGSHALMEQYFLEGGKLSLSPDVHNVLTSYAMSSALTDVAQALRTDPPAYAMGYSVYYYYVNSYWLLGDVNGGGELKLLAVDGVLPSDETIADGSYPLAGYNYVVFRADEPEDSPARRLAAFMLSAAGQDCVRNAGFGPLSNDPLADFKAANPGCTVETILPAEAGGYVVLSRAGEDGSLRASYLVRGDAGWGELQQAECPPPGAEPLSAAVLKTRGSTLLFGQIRESTACTVRLTYGGGQTARCRLEAYAGQSFHLLLDGSPELEKLELLQGGQVLYSRTDFS